MSKSGDKTAKSGKSEKSDAPNPTLRTVTRALEWPGMLGWFGIIFGAAGLWFFVSAIVLGVSASKIDADSESAVDDQSAADVAESSRSFGFGDQYMLTIVRPRRVDGKAALRVPRPLKGLTRQRVHMAVAANARSSWVFTAHALFVALFLWGLRLFEPAIRAEHEPAPAKPPAA